MAAAGTSAAQQLPGIAADIVGWERTRWGMSTLEVDNALPRGLRADERGRYVVDRLDFAGMTLPAEFIMVPGRGLSAIHFGGGLADVSREREAGVVERTLRRTYGDAPLVRTLANINRADVHELERELEWSFPSTRIVLHRYFLRSADGAIADGLTVSFLRTATAP